jgi:hypothetical protein
LAWRRRLLQEVSAVTLSEKDAYELSLRLEPRDNSNSAGHWRESGWVRKPRYALFFFFLSSSSSSSFSPVLLLLLLLLLSSSASSVSSASFASSSASSASASAESSFSSSPATSVLFPLLRHLLLFHPP